MKTRHGGCGGHQCHALQVSGHLHRRRHLRHRRPVLCAGLQSGIWATTGQIEALGWLAVALVIFTTWKPLNAIWGATCSVCSYWLYQFLPSLLGITLASYMTDLVQMLPLCRHHRGADRGFDAQEKGKSAPGPSGARLLPRGAVKKAVRHIFLRKRCRFFLLLSKNQHICRIYSFLLKYHLHKEGGAGMAEKTKDKA